MSPRGYIEPCLGTGAVLLALLDARAKPLVAYQGGKGRLAGDVLHALGLRPGQGAASVSLAEAGPLGWVWRELLDCGRAAALADLLRSWDGDPEPRWRALVAEGIPTSPTRRAAAVLFLQAGQARGRPLRIRDGGWRVEGYAHLTPSAVARGFTSRVNVRALAARLEHAAALLARQPVRFVHGDATAAIPPGSLDGYAMYLDPPYRGRRLYEGHMTRREVLMLAQDGYACGADVVVSEAEPLPLGWSTVEVTCIPSRPEWLTCSRWPRAVQVGLFAEVRT